ncbi:hypothetical protein [Polyangium fumosum]|uniref:VDE lipocalin domain-containing protein n=1 Tax=Polyangium fumosum TaxID=889272 RepID=A0A4V5PN34_9BACT|nr:hypothetical protein [Polyangium fumosum]TKD09226.1 hypothetical protein E8A74_13205 [Polyangium fumosum]
MDRGGKRLSRTRWAFLSLVGAPLLLAWLSGAAGCTEEDPPEPRPGFPGDSCTKTDDCAVPLRCIDNVCVVPGGSGGSDGGTEPDAFGPGPGPSADAGPWSQCDECLEGTCGQAEKACGPDCRSIEACIETVCVNLSDSPQDESACFVYCQDRFPAGKDQHLAVVNCALEVMCSPPCTFYPQDYDLCRTFMNNGDCTGFQKACEADARCGVYRDCVKFCTSIGDCTACDDSADGTEGRKLLEAYEQCVASECMTESWIP